MPDAHSCRDTMTYYEKFIKFWISEIQSFLNDKNYHDIEVILRLSTEHILREP